MSNAYYKLAAFATVFTLMVILLGAYTRLTDAGLGCPDWPGCYGQLTVPKTPAQLEKADKLYPDKPVETSKAWAEMIHRYVAGTLGIIIFILGGWALLRRRKHALQPLIIPIVLCVLVVFQALLGMWTVTWQLLPLVVMGHLMGGMALAALLWWLTLKSGNCLKIPQKPLNRLRPWAILGLVIVALQIFLGGWTSANYAAVVCPTFPFCHGQLFPPMNFAQAFDFFHPIGQNYDGGVLDTTARVTIQMTHRYGAFITALYFGCLSLSLIFSKAQAKCRGIGWAILLILALQITLGVLNVVLLLPLSVATAHTVVAALLLLSVVTLIYQTYRIRHEHAS